MKNHKRLVRIGLIALGVGAVLLSVFSLPEHIVINFENRIRHNRGFDKETNEAMINLINRTLRIIYQRDDKNDIDLNTIFTENFLIYGSGSGTIYDSWFNRSYSPFLRVNRNYMRTIFESTNPAIERFVVYVTTIEGIDPFEITRFVFVIILDEFGTYKIDSVGLDR